MKYSVCCLLFIFLGLNALSQELKKGELITVTQCYRVSVENPNGIRQQYSFIRKGEKVFTNIGAKIKIVKIEGDRVFVKYYIKGWQFGSSAPSRTRFYLDYDQVLRMKYDAPAK